jgi:organic radical activating enzyme
MAKYAIDIVGTCNLKCPSCARREKYTDLRAAPAYKGLMNYDLFLRVLDKIEENSPNQKNIIGLYVWGEPLMHNRIGDIVTEIGRRGWEAHISTNGNATKHLESAIKAKPKAFSISVSGFEKETYNATHYLGEVETVMSTIFLAWNLIKRHSPDTDFLIHYHLYKDNGGENLATLQRILAALKCDYMFSVGQVLALDDVLDVFDGRGNLADEKTNVLNKLIFSPQDWQRMSLEVAHEHCDQIEGDWVIINADASVSLCCATFGDEYKLFPSYLDTTDKQIFAARRASKVCARCMAAGVPFASAVTQHSPTFRKGVNEALVANGGIKHVECRSLGVKNHLALHGSLQRHLTNAVKRRLSRLQERLTPVARVKAAPAEAKRISTPSST